MIISLDCETNGLLGSAFAAAAAFVDDYGAEIDVWTARCPIAGDVDPWVAANVLPALSGMPDTCEDYDGLLSAWRAWYAACKDAYPEVLVLGHVVHPVESRFLRDAHADDPFAGPFPLLDTASMFHARGYAPESVDEYLSRRGIGLPCGSPHDPLYDARAAARAYLDLM